MQKKSLGPRKEQVSLKSVLYLRVDSNTCYMNAALVAFFHVLQTLGSTDDCEILNLLTQFFANVDAQNLVELYGYIKKQPEFQTFEWGQMEDSLKFARQMVALIDRERAGISSFLKLFICSDDEKVPLKKCSNASCRLAVPIPPNGFEQTIANTKSGSTATIILDCLLNYLLCPKPDCKQPREGIHLQVPRNFFLRLQKEKHQNYKIDSIIKLSNSIELKAVCIICSTGKHAVALSLSNKEKNWIVLNDWCTEKELTQTDTGFCPIPVNYLVMGVLYQLNTNDSHVKVTLSDLEFQIAQYKESFSTNDEKERSILGSLGAEQDFDKDEWKETNDSCTEYENQTLAHPGPQQSWLSKLLCALV